MGLLDSLKQVGGDALHSAADSAYDSAAKQVGLGTPTPPPTVPQGSQTTAGAGPSPKSADALHFSPSGIVAYIKANPLKGAGLVLVAVGLGYLAYKRFAR